MVSDFEENIYIMKIKLCIFLLFAVACNSNAPRENVSQEGSFDYLGQAFPGDSAIVFAPGIICDTATRESALAISPNGDELFFVKGIWPETKIMHMDKTGNKWSSPDTAYFCEDSWGTEPAFSPDGRFLYYSSSKGKPDISFYSLWRVELTDAGWSEPENIFDIGGDTVWEFHPTISDDGMLYFCYWDVAKRSGDIYMSDCKGSKCSDPVRMNFPVNSDSSDADPYIRTDGSYMIFATNRPGGLGGHDQYITYKNTDGTWAELKNLGDRFNTPGDDYDMDITPDGKYILLYLNNDIYWMRNTGL